MKSLLLILFFFCAGVSLGQPAPVWSSSINAEVGSYSKYFPKVKATNSGNLIVVCNIYNGFYNNDILIIKFNSVGSILWTQTYNGILNKDDEATDFQIDTKGNIYITGITVIDSLDTDILAVKFDKNGNLEWANHFDGIAGGKDNANSIKIDSLENSFITGFKTIDTLIGVRLVCLKLDSVGNKEWEYIYGSDTIGNYEGIKIELIDSELHVLGVYQPLADYNEFIQLRIDSSGTMTHSAEGQILGSISSSYIDNLGNSYVGTSLRMKIVKISPIGNILWSADVPSNLPSNVSGDEIKAIVVDSLQNVYISGRHYGEGYSGPNYTNADILTIKYNSNGDELWSNRYENLGNNAADIANSIALDKKLNVYVAGQSQSDISGNDYVIVQLDSSGTSSGTIRYDHVANGDDFVTSIVVRDSSSIYVTGLTFDSPLPSITTQKYSSTIQVGISEISLRTIILDAVPNPFSNSFSIQFSNETRDIYYFQLIDNTGKRILHQQTNGEMIEIPAEDLRSGIYNFVLHSNRCIYHGKVIKTQ